MSPGGGGFMSARRLTGFIPVWTVIAQRRAAADARFIGSGLTSAALFMGPATFRCGKTAAEVTARGGAPVDRRPGFW